MKKLSSRFRNKRIIFLGLVAMLACSLHTNAQENDSSTNEDVFELSPFEVDGSLDQGYFAANSLAGTRLNTSLRDISSIIDVYTLEFMNDLAATDLQDVTGYANNFVQDTEDDTHGQAHTLVEAHTSFNYRIRGLPAGRGRNYFEYSYPFDSYNIERLDESRGPNAILFGFGSPGGIINQSTKFAHFGKRTGGIELTTGSEVKGRLTLDLNKVIIEDILALRVNLLKHEEEGWKTFTHDDREAYNVSATIRPFKTTKIKIEYEDFQVNDLTSRPFNHFNQATKWIAEGSPLIAGGWDQRSNDSLNPNITSDDLNTLARTFATNDNNNDAYWLFNSNSGETANWRGMVFTTWRPHVDEDGNRVTFFQGGRTVALEPEGILEVNVLGPGGYRDLDLINKTAIIQQQVFEKLYFEVAATENDSEWTAFTSNPSNLRADPNVWLPQATVTSNLPDINNPVLNPYAGLFYFDDYPILRTQTQEFTAWRISGSYEFDFEDVLESQKWNSILGKHRIAALYEDSEITVLEVQNRENVLIDGELPRPDLPHDARNRFVRRTYIEDPNDPMSYHLGDYMPISFTSDDGKSITTEWLPFRRRFDFTRNNESKMIAFQSFWFGGKLVTSIGSRKDDLEFQSYGELRDTTNGTIVRDLDSLTISKYSGETNLYGAVFHLSQYISAFVNKSDSLGVPDFPRTMTPDGSFNEPTRGEGDDMGFKFSLFDQRLSIVATRFNSAQTNDTRGGNPDQWGQNDIVEALVVQGFLNEPEAEQFRLYGNGHTWDTETEGYELSVVGRISRNLNVRLNYSWTDKSITNIAPRLVNWVENVGRPFWQSFDRDNPNTPEADNILDTITTGETTTLRERIDSWEGNLTNIIRNGTTLRGLRKHKVSAFVNYNFSEGILEDLGVGAGLRYMSAPVIGQDENGDNWLGESNISFDFLGKYKATIFGEDIVFQLNIRNAFRDNVEWSPISRIYGDNIDAIVTFPPREFLFTVRYDF